MPLTRLYYFSTAFLLHCLLGLVLGTGLVLPASARTHRVHKLHHNHLHRRVHIPRMLPTFIPAAREGYSTILRGRASWYGRQFQGARTTSGERFNRHAYTCAHKTLPFGTRLRVTNLANGTTVVVRVTDRGPFRHERILDLAEVAARPLGIVNSGAATVVAEIVDPTTPLGLTEAPANLALLRTGDPNPKAPFTAYQLPQADSASLALAPDVVASAPVVAGPLAAAPATPRFGVQAGTFADAQNAQAVAARILALDPRLPATVAAVVVDGRPLNRVVIGQFDSWLAAETVRRNLQLWGIAGLVCQVPPADKNGAGSAIASVTPAPPESTALRR